MNSLQLHRQLSHQHDGKTIPVQTDDLCVILTWPGEDDSIHLVFVNQTHVACAVIRLQRFQEDLKALRCGGLFDAQQNLGQQCVRKNLLLTLA